MAQKFDRSPSLRALTTAERALIQTFPKDFVWIGNKTDTEQMIGNAVPVKLAEFVASSLLKYIQSQDTATVDYIWNIEGFETWLIETKKYSCRAARDVVSRCKRIDKIYHCEDHLDAYYLFMLQQQTEYQQLSSSVKSQLKRAVALQLEYSSL